MTKEEQDKIDWTGVINAADSHLSDVEENGRYLYNKYSREDKEAIFKAVMEAIYGKNIWKYYNNKID